MASLCVCAIYFSTIPWTTQDGANHKKVALILSRLSTSSVENHVYESQLGPLSTNELFPLLHQPLAPYLTPDHYEKLYVVFSMLFLLIAYKFFLSTWAPDSAAWWPLILPLCLHPLFTMGLYNFLISVPLTLTALALLKRGLDSRRPWLFLPFLATCYLAFLAHPFPFFILAPCGVLLAWQQRPRHWGWLVLYATPILFFLLAGFLPSLLFTGRHEAGLSYQFNSIPELIGAFWSRNITAYSLLQLLAGLPIIACLVALAVHSARSRSPLRFYWMALALGFALFPVHGNQGSLLNKRFLPYIWCFIPLGVQLSAIWYKRCIAVVMTCTVILAALTWRGMAATAQIITDARVVYSALPAQSRVYPIVFDFKGPAYNINALTHLWANFPDDRLVFSPYLFAYSALYPLHLKSPSTATYFPATREDFAADVASGSVCKEQQTPHGFTDCDFITRRGYNEVLGKAVYYDDWFVFNPTPQFVAQLQAVPGLHKVKESGKASLWHFDKARAFTPNPLTP